MWRFERTIEQSGDLPQSGLREHWNEFSPEHSKEGAGAMCLNNLIGFGGATPSIIGLYCPALDRGGDPPAVKYAISRISG